ncbi:MAG: cell division protein FtsA [Armatimonadota bacterium]
MENAVVGLDVGTTKICTVVGRPLQDGRLEVLGVGVVPSVGLKRGVVVDLEDAVESVRQSVRRAEESSTLDIRSAYVGVTGDHVSSLNVAGRAMVSAGTEVTQEDCDRVLQAARDNVGGLGPSREIVHVIPREFSLDGQPGIRRPVGMSGRRLEVAAHVVTGLRSVLDNVGKCVEAVGVQVLEKVLEPIATAEAVLSEAERELGVALIDVGGGTADIAIFLDGSICHTSAIPVAGDYVTRDLAIGLRVPRDQAEDLKRKAGIALIARADDRQRVGIRLAGTGEPQHVPRRLLAEIIQPRLEETFDLVREDLRRSGLYDLIGGVVLTGGGSLLPGTLDLASRALDDNRVRLGEPQRITGLVAPLSGPAFGTAVGLAMYGAARLAEEPEPAPPLAAPPEPWFAEAAHVAADLFRRLIRRE